jgi:hypothetical protein
VRALPPAYAAAPPPEPHGLSWRTVCVDAVCVLMSDQHPLAGRDEFYRDTVERRPRYAAWLGEHPEFGAVVGAVAPWGNE